MKAVARFVILAGAAALLFSACNKEIVNSDLKLDESKTATIKIKLLAATNTYQWIKQGKSAEPVVMKPPYQCLYSDLPAGASLILNAAMKDLGVSGATGDNVLKFDLSGKELTATVVVSPSGTAYKATFTDLVTECTYPVQPLDENLVPQTNKGVQQHKAPFLYKHAILAGELSSKLMPGEVRLLKVLYCPASPYVNSQDVRSSLIEFNKDPEGNFTGTAEFTSIPLTWE